MIIVTGCLSFGASFEFIILPLYVILFGILICAFAFFIPVMLGGQIIFYYVCILNVYSFIKQTKKK